MCCPDGDREVKRALVVLDVTGEAVERAIRGGYDLIVSHHPMIFGGLKSVTDGDAVAKKVIDLVKNGVSVMSFHTRLDAVEGGVNDTLSALLGLVDVEIFGNAGETIGRVGTLAQETSLADFATEVKSALGAPFVLVSDAGRPVRRVAILGGEGGDDVEAARASGTDTYVSGRLGYHKMTDAPDGDINLIEAGHFYTEQPVCHVLAKMISEADGKIQTEIFVSNRIKAI
jgi:dinuclear metal center YbgI/SA1388 family protein